MLLEIGLSLIAVIMKAPTSPVRFSEAQKLLDYGFSTFEYKEFAQKGNTIEVLPVAKGIQSTVEAICEDTAGCLLEKGQEKNMVQEIELAKNLSAPVVVGQKLRRN